ncbi:MAG TPA: plastocyanin/azurin family copper-binding protein [Symbiobacteriaceae bacterium]|nr:plastocyanin/azurin family copper-binding protein [Symbiobacteriaceae bacterium]
MKRWGVAALAAGVLLAAVGCSSAKQVDAVVMEVTAADMAFGSKEITVEKGKPVKLVFKNEDIQLHDLSVDKIDVKVQGGHNDGHDMGGKKPDLHLSADAGKNGEIIFTATEPGTYTFYCTVPGHKDAGMIGSLIVK